MRQNANRAAVKCDSVRWVLGLLMGLAAPMDLAPAATPATPVADADLLAAVRPFPRGALVPGETTPRNRRLLDAYFDSVRAWSDVLADRFQAVPGHPSWGYYGLGGHVEDEVRPITYAVLVNGFLSESGPQAGAPDDAGGRCCVNIVRPPCGTSRRHM